MASVWKRLQRVNKRAAKFQYTASYHRIDLETSPKWKPNKLSIVWTRRSRRVITEPLEWEPSLKDPLKGSVIYTIPENQTVAVTLFKDSRTNELEDKDWTFVLEDVSVTGKRRRLAVAALNMRRFASLEPSQRALTLPLDPTTHKVTAASIHLTLHCVLLREGHATDEDMQSLASLFSVNNNSDIAVLEELDEDDYTLSDNSTKEMLELRHQMEEMTHSLTNSDIAATPNSVQSLNFDNSRTPTALSPPSPTTPINPAPDPEPKNFASLPQFPKIFTEPKTSTPKMSEFNSDLKSIVLKPRTITKRELKPLELKTNLNSISLDRNDNEREQDNDKTPTSDMDKFSEKFDKDKTPVQDLLEWCQAATREYSACRVTNLTTSFRSGLAFCAIIHRYRPDLIDFSGLQPDEAETNLRTAFEASAKLGISQVLSAGDVCAPPAPDRLAIMTYLFQLRAHFTGSELQVEQLGSDETESSYLVGRHDTDGELPPELFSREVSARRSRNIERTRPRSQEAPPPEPLRDSLLQHSRSILGKVLSPREQRADTKWFVHPLDDSQPPPARPEKLMTRKELTDPFGSDDEEEQTQELHISEQTNGDRVDEDQQKEVPSSTTPEVTQPLQPIQPTLPQAPTERKSLSPDLPKPTPQLLSRHDELKERARQLLEATKREAREKEKRRKEAEDVKENALRNGDVKDGSKKPMTEEERQAMLRERARKLIADAKAGIVSHAPSPLSPRGGRVEIISEQSVMEEIAAAGGADKLDALLGRSEPTPPVSPTPPSPLAPATPPAQTQDGIEGRNTPRRSPLRSFTALVEQLTPDLEKEHSIEDKETGSYIQSELEALEREQRAIDERAASLEKQLRRVMESADNTQEEDKLMSQWFNLVNKKNALLRRQMQLNILEKEVDLSRRCELLARELRLTLGVDEWRKTPGQKRRERLLLQELLSSVNERDRLVQEMDEQEKAIADDDEIQRNLSQVEIQRRNNCILQ